MTQPLISTSLPEVVAYGSRRKKEAVLYAWIPYAQNDLSHQYSVDSLLRLFGLVSCPIHPQHFLSLFFTIF